MPGHRSPTRCETCGKVFVGNRGLLIHKSKIASCNNLSPNTVVKQVFHQFPLYESQKLEDEDEENRIEAEFEELIRQDVLVDPFPRLFSMRRVGGPNLRRTRFFFITEFFCSMFEMFLAALIVIPTLGRLLSDVPIICYLMVLLYAYYHHLERIVKCVSTKYRYLVDRYNRSL